MHLKSKKVKPELIGTCLEKSLIDLLEVYPKNLVLGVK